MATKANPSPLASQYEIRQLTAADQLFTRALCTHANWYYSPLWTAIYKQDAAQMWRMMDECDYLVQHLIDSGLSYGVFDTQYRYKRSESEATSGALYWDRSQPTDKQTLLEQMDFPLVSIVLSYDASHPLDKLRMQPLMLALPVFGQLYDALAAGDRRTPEWRATAPRQVLMRNGTVTRAGYERTGLMKGVSHWLMRQAKLLGFRGIQIECAHPAVYHVWAHPPAPYTAEVVSLVDTATFELEETDTGKVKPFVPAEVVCSKVYVTL